MNNLPATRVQRQRLLTTKLRTLGIKAHDYFINYQGINLRDLCIKRINTTQHETHNLIKLSNLVYQDKGAIPFFTYLYTKLD